MVRKEGPAISFFSIIRKNKVILCLCRVNLAEDAIIYSPSPSCFFTEGKGRCKKMLYFLSMWSKDFSGALAIQIKSGLLHSDFPSRILLCSIQPALYVNYLLWTTEHLKFRFMSRLGETVFSTSSTQMLKGGRVFEAVGARFRLCSPETKVQLPGTPGACLRGWWVCGPLGLSQAVVKETE